MTGDAIVTCAHAQFLSQHASGIQLLWNVMTVKCLYTQVPKKSWLQWHVTLCASPSNNDDARCHFVGSLAAMTSLDSDKIPKFLQPTLGTTRMHSESVTVLCALCKWHHANHPELKDALFCSFLHCCLTISRVRASHSPFSLGIFTVQYCTYCTMGTICIKIPRNRLGNCFRKFSTFIQKKSVVSVLKMH